MSSIDKFRARLLREIHDDLRMAGVLDATMDISRPALTAEIRRLPKYIAGEEILHRYAASAVERRLNDLETRVAALESET